MFNLSISCVLVQEQSDGAVNGVNCVYALSHKPALGPVMVFANGVYLTPGIDYDIGVQTIVMRQPLLEGSAPSAVYLGVQ